MPHDSSKGGSFKKIKYTPCYTPLDPLNQPVPKIASKFPFIEKERQTEYFNSKDKRSFASSFSITKNKRFSLLDPKETKDHDSSTNYYNIFNTKIRTRNTQKDNARTFFASTDKNAHVLCVDTCLLYTSPSPRDLSTSRMPSSACKKKKKNKIRKKQIKT
eukprot:TRINITY_DN14590_c0_g1_i2.p1 TRINITY_DN14590_c0_g1~~TRINITY_DN14590_c0_g1_i2.p1  ORF type:complete len:160 (+),score=18.93 TRINITY_DN14590_c0_g1_i2:241-720(+)